MKTNKTYKKGGKMLSSKYLGFQSIKLENQHLAVNILPDLGFKIASIYHKDKEFEFLHQPAKGSYDQAEYGADFSKFDTSGIDDCIPTIDECKYPGSYTTLPDHGDTWSVKFDVLETTDSSATGRVKLRSLPLEFEKKITLEDKKINIQYRVKNLSDKAIYYLWAFHGLNNYSKDTEIEFPKEYQNYINVQNDEVWDFDITKLRNFKDNHTFKYYFTDELKAGKVSLVHKDVDLKYTINFDTHDLPYLGVWLTTGGFKGEKNVAIEPCNGFYDSLEKAVELGKAKQVLAKETDSWEITLEISEL